MLGAERRHRSQNQVERRAKPARRSSRCIYPKTAARELHQSRSVLKNQNPQNGQHWARFDWGSGAVCFGASSVATVFGSAPGSATPPEHRIYCKPAPPAPPSKQDISTLPGIGHFYFALTMRIFEALRTVAVSSLLEATAPFGHSSVYLAGLNRAATKGSGFRRRVNVSAATRLRTSSLP
jgi:hypothetical protein